MRPTTLAASLLAAALSADAAYAQLPAYHGNA
jgi:hypothetical protein